MLEVCFLLVFFIYWLKLYSIGKWKPRTTGRIKREQQIQSRKTHKGSMAKSNLSAAEQPQEEEEKEENDVDIFMNMSDFV